MLRNRRLGSTLVPDVESKLQAGKLLDELNSKQQMEIDDQIKADVMELMPYGLAEGFGI